MGRNWNKPILAVSFLCLIAAAVTSAWSHLPRLSSPTYDLRLAIAPSVSSEGEKFFAAFVRNVAQEYPFVRFRTFPTDTWDAAGKALLDRSADLALLRSDDPAAGQGRTLVIVRKLVAVFLADSKSKIENPRALSGKKIGVLEGGHDDRLVKAILEFYGFQSGNIMRIPAAEAGKAVRERRVAALLVVGPVGPGPLLDAITAIRKATKSEPSFLDIEEVETFSKQYPVYDTTEIPKGAFGGMSLEPAEAVDTVAVTLRLVSRASLPNRTAGEITRIILATKGKLAASIPMVGQIEAPDPEEPGVLPVHPGTITYLKGEQQSLYQLANDNLYSLMIAGGLLASFGGWMFGLFRRRKPDQSAKALTRLSELRREVAAGALRPAEIEQELDEIAGTLFDRMITERLEPERFIAASTIIDQIRRQAHAAVSSTHEFRTSESRSEPALAGNH